jgi:hypothetical protein
MPAHAAPPTPARSVPSPAATPARPDRGAPCTREVAALGLCTPEPGR